MKEEILALFIRHRGKILGCVGGFVLGWLIISRGLIQTLILFICAGLGYYIGKRLDDGENWKRSWSISGLLTGDNG